MSDNGSFHVQLTCIMETLTTSAIAEITKLVDYSSALLFSEISRQRGENEALRKALQCMEIELRTERPKANEDGKSVDLSSEVQLCDETRLEYAATVACAENHDVVSCQLFPDEQLDVSDIHYGGDTRMETGETNAPEVFKVKKECPEVKQIIFHPDAQGNVQPWKNEEASQPEEGGHLSGEVNGVLPPSYKHQTPEEHQSEAHHSSTAEPQEDETNGEPGIWVKSESGPASETVRLTPAAADNQAVEHLPGRDKITCSYCNKHFNYRSQLIIHERVHTRERPFVCKQCGKGFSQINNLTKHQLSHKAGEGQHKCKECGKVFRHAQSLRNHGASVHGFFKRLACQTCGKTLHTKNALLAHTSTHERTFRCEICGKSFGTKQILKSHQFTHTGERPFVCNYCGKSFAFLCNLKTHERVHTGEKPFGCERCGRRFTQKHVLEKHLCKA
ncbi:zinc finger protein 16-like isoform X1 [Esox lucius]|uniref:zinc finger protein 16-like isoform X1 n=1 Tax=Esox lucius TaxID=8010 RepID=UPI001476D663|nr:zinc finger protein 16-like isoform X1 [Esox lucius]